MSINLLRYQKRFTFSRVKCYKPQLGPFNYSLNVCVLYLYCLFVCLVLNDASTLEVH